MNFDQINEQKALRIYTAVSGVPDDVTRREWARMRIEDKHRWIRAARAAASPEVTAGEERTWLATYQRIYDQGQGHELHEQAVQSADAVIRALRGLGERLAAPGAEEVHDG